MYPTHTGRGPSTQRLSLRSITRTCVFTTHGASSCYCSDQLNCGCDPERSSRSRESVDPERSSRYRETPGPGRSYSWESTGLVQCGQSSSYLSRRGLATLYCSQRHLCAGIVLLAHPFRAYLRSHPARLQKMQTFHVNVLLYRN